MRKKIILCLISTFGLWGASHAQVTSGSGGSIGANSPTSNINVGIKYNQPKVDLDVKDSLRVTSTGGGNHITITSPGAFHIIRTTNNMAFVLDNNAKLDFNLGGTIRTTMLSNGNVGIGNTAPTQRLDVAGNTVVSGYSLIGTTTMANTFSKMQIHNGALLLSGTNSGGGPMVNFTDNASSSAYPNGRYGIEYIPNSGLNFWIPWNPSPGSSGNYVMFLKDDRKVAIGIDPTHTTGSMPTSMPNGYKLFVKDGILTEHLKVAIYGTTDWADYVFADEYKLMPLNEVEQFVAEHKHLPNFPSAQAIVDGGGIEVEKVMAKQMEKIEELTLYIIEQNKRIERLEAMIQGK